MHKVIELVLHEPTPRQLSQNKVKRETKHLIFIEIRNKLYAFKKDAERKNLVQINEKVD